MADSNTNPSPPCLSRLAESAYNSPYTRAGAPTPHPNTDPYAPLRAQALATLESMGYDPLTMVERGVVWAEDQDPFGHVMQSQYMAYMGVCFHRVMESYAEFLSDEEYNNMILAKTVVPVVRKYELDIRRQVKYPDALIVAYRGDGIEATRNNGITSIFSLKQQAIVAEVRGNVTYMDVKTGRPVNICKLGGGWLKLFEGFTKKAENARILKEIWESKNAKGKGKGSKSGYKI
ncbi:hypothetical protein B0J11DRAFT_599212 [Dendryphion nanum]|uniref:Uncharacterized protein n=1 Tax=Dendryphion nanum TaxID=256645 RepID=A0A9P9D1D0_9PLEO|nr:hypothetical protein B0J11DRAFT_599212 [Dendryphion nanum]